ncbi:hypothetical protein E2C01_068732 [Portunus trituberculatus]|uniref:Uncharacterized protein n=1 Tax=Portunus trituberculatus TaxID=210409 RepID=A0A5B7I0W6_PORTR|nr:hypothetical protein [Portunus trituberculatus]
METICILLPVGRFGAAYLNFLCSDLLCSVPICVVKARSNAGTY